MQDQDKQTLAQIDAIQNEIKTSQALTSDLMSISKLAELYNKGGGTNSNDASSNSNNNTSNFLNGCEYLATRYTKFRSIRGDGNCYYRAFLYAMCETLLSQCHDMIITTANADTKQDSKESSDEINSSQRLPSELIRLRKHMQTSLDEVTKQGYDRYTLEMFHEEFVELLDNIKPSTTKDELHSQLSQENGTSDYCTWYLRVLCATHLKQNASHFIHFLEDPSYIDIASFCSREVEPMGKEVTELMVLALAEALKVRVNIEYLDGRDLPGSKKELVVHKFGPRSDDEADCLEISLLYRPGHYDILY